MTTREKPRRGTFVVIRAASTLYALIDRDDRRRSLLLMVFNLINTLFDIVALLLIIPLVTTLSSGTAPSYLSGPNAIVSLPSWVLSNPVVAIGGAVALLFIIRAGLGTLQLWWSGGVAHRAEVDLVWRLLNGSATISYSDHLDRDSGEIFRAVTDSVVRAMNLLGLGLSAAGDLILTLGIGAVIIAVNPVVGGLLIVYLAVAIGGWTFVARARVQRAGAVMGTATQARFKALQQGALLARELRLNGRAHSYAMHAVDQSGDVASARRMIDFIIPANRYVLETVVILGIVLSGAVASVTSGSASVLPTLAVMLAAMFRGLPALYRMMQFTNQCDYTMPALDALREYAASGGLAASGAEPGRPVQPPATAPRIAFTNVSFRYPRGHTDVLTDITLTIEPGMRLGIKGSSGAGKSTLLELLLGLREPTTGTITVASRPLSDDMARHQRGIGYVPQTVPLLDDTVAANIAPGWDADEVDHNQVRAVLVRVGLGAWLDGLPNGTSTVLGPGGPRMSGGQQLRLGLARALYAGPVILVIDEVTAHLDPVATDEIVAVLDGLDRSITQVAVAHDPVAVAYCDLVIDLTGGRIAASAPGDVVGPITA